MKQDIILIGGGGHCVSVIDVIEASSMFAICGIIDSKVNMDKDILGYKVIGTDEDIDELLKHYKNFHITIGHIKSNKARVRLFELVKSKGGYFPTILSPEAYVSKHATIHEGTVVMHKAVVNAHASVGKNCIINTSSVIEHDAVIHDHCHISTGAFINGECIVDPNCFIGSNSTLAQQIHVKENCLIAAGSVITQHTEANHLYAGNPAKAKKRID